jgi:hypothetical protein
MTIYVSIFKNAKDVSNPFNRMVEICLQRIIEGNSMGLLNIGQLMD